MNNILPVLNFTELDGVQDILKFLKIQLVGFETSISKLTDISQQLQTSVFSRLTLIDTNNFNSKQLKQQLRQQRYKHEWIAVEPNSADVASVAARDRRVDAVRITPRSKLKIFNTRYGRRLSENNKIVEIDLSFLWQQSIAVKLRPILRVLQAFKSCNLSYIIVNLPTNRFGLRSYRGLQSIGRLFELANTQTSAGSLIERLDRNRKKINGIIPFEGVEVIEW